MNTIYIEVYLSKEFSAEANRHVRMVLNTIIKKDEKKLLITQLFGIYFDYSMLHIFKYHVFVYISKKRRKKLDQRRGPSIYLRVMSSEKTYHL